MGACTGNVRVPEFAYTLLDGTRRASRDLRGRIVLVSFWSTTCTVCLAEMPHLVGLHREFGPRGFVLLAVAMSHDAPARVADYAQSRGLPFGVVIDNTGAIARAFGDVRVTPSGFLLDRQGAIAHRWTGAQPVDGLRRMLERLLSGA